MLRSGVLAASPDCIGTSVSEPSEDSVHPDHGQATCHGFAMRPTLDW